MAFSATIQNIQYIGPGQTTLTGIWTGSAGDAAGSMSVSGTVTQAHFQAFDVDNTYQILPRTTTSQTNGITTVTINNQDDVGNGYFQITKLG